MTRCASPAARRYARRLFVAMAAYLVTLALAVAFVRDGGVTGPLAWPLALLPGLSVASIFWIIGRLLVEENDEYLRMLLVRQALFASGFALSVATLWGFLDTFGLVPRLPAFYLAVLWFLGLGLGNCWTWLSDRGAGSAP